ncbi:something about silencing protein 10, partial [Tilletia horrida]
MPRGRGSKGPEWESAGDIPMDEQDAFLANRDHITFGSSSMNDAGSSRARGEQLDQHDEDGVHEVFRLQTALSDDDEELDDDEDEDDDEEMADALPPSTRSQKLKQKKAAAAAAAAATEAGDSDSDSDSDASVSDRAHFGRSKRAYYASTNALDSASEAGSDGATTDEENELSPEQRRQMELREVRKMATAARKGMDERDFGLEDELELAAAAAAGASAQAGWSGKTAEQRARERRRAALLGDEAAVSGPSGSQAQNVHVALPTDPETVAAMLRDLHAKDALTLALAGEFADSVHEWGVLEEGMAKAGAELPPDHPSFSLMHIYQQTFLTYLTTLTFYFYLRTSPAYSPSPSDPAAAEATLQKLRQHPVVTRLTELKEALANMEDLGFRVDLAESSDIDEDELAPVFRSEDGDETFDIGELEDGELDDLLADEKENQVLSILADPTPSAATAAEDAPAARPKTKKSKKAKAAADAAPPVVRGPLAELEDLVSLSAPVPSTSASKRKSVSKSTLTDAEAAEALGELTSLTAAEKAEKQARKRSLRFYTGQIASRDPLAPSSSSQSGKGGKAAAMSGDADIPYTDRERSRKAVEAAAEAKRLRANGLAGASAGDIALDGSDAWGEADQEAWRDVMDAEPGAKAPASAGKDALDGMDLDAQGDDDADYYDLVATSKQSRKKAKQDAYDEARLEERYQPEDTLEDGEHRSLNRTIEKNRGLTPHRPKAVRNPRVKKRLKYESAKKKLSSSRPVYKGGQSSLEGGYGGEKSGISEGIVRSRSFS